MPQVGVGVGATFRTVTAISAWNPLDIFAGGQGGAWYDPSDLSHMWQDTAGTVAVTTDGQSVLRIDDKSGNGLHLTQATGALAPLYKTSGGLHWLQFNGTTQFMSRVATNLSAYFRATGFVSFRRNADDAQRYIMEHGVTGSVPGFDMRSPSGANTNFSSQGRGATGAASAARATSAAPVSVYATSMIDIQAPSTQLRTFGVAGTAVTTATGGGNFGTATLMMGARTTLLSFMSGNIYQLILAMKTASAAEILNAENHCRVKAGL